jgi:hypothetical protein
MSIRPLILIAVGVFAVCIQTLQAQNEQMKITATGHGANRQEALINAKRNAIEKGIGTILISQTEVENFQLKRDQVITKTMGSVQDFSVENESQKPDGSYDITITAVISKSSMRKDLASFHILIQSMNKPKLMILVQENNVGNKQPTNDAAESALIQFFKTPYGFEIVDPSVISTIKQSKEKMAQIAGNPARAAEIATSYGAQVLIAGKAVSRKAESMTQSLGGMTSIQADVTLRAINCNTARIIASAEAHDAEVHISPNTAGNNAIANSAKDAGKKLLGDIIDDWQNLLNNGMPLQVDIHGVTSFSQRTKVVNVLKTVAGVSEVQARGWNKQSGVLTADITYKGNPDGFCSKVDGTSLPSGAASLAVSGLNGMRVSLSVQSKE